jgi:NAD(P)-dependent dehydrogenase (short-subunit alcohol dehydrogenase family)
MIQARRTVLITGTSSGFGLLAAVALARRGYQVYATMRNLQKQERLQVACAAANVKVEARALDVTKPDTIAAVVEEIETRAGGVGVLINNAGFAYGGFFEDTSDADFRDQFATNFFGLLSCTRAVLPGMRQRQHGLVIQISSIAGLSGMPTLSAYTASKFAVEGFSESLRYEVKRFGIHVVLVEPGTFKTDIFLDTNRKNGAGVDNQERPYYQLYRNMEKEFMALEAKWGQNPERVVRRIVKIVESKRPKLRYIVGTDARIEGTLKKLLPGSWYEFLLEKLVLDKFKNE